MSDRLSGAAVRWSAGVFAVFLLFSPVARAATPDFAAYLSEGYHQLSGKAGKSALAQFYAKRGVSAAAGHAPQPVQPDKATPDGIGVGELTAARDKLIESLDAGGRERQPLLAAIAQINFDCWAKPLPKRKGAPRSIDCYSRFLLAFQGLPDKHHRGPISSVEAWQFADLSPAPDTGSLAQRVAGSSDAIGSLILSLSSPAMTRGSAAYDGALAASYVVGSMPGDESVMGSCDRGCMPLDFSGPGTAPLIAALTRDRSLQGPGNSKAGPQSANAGGSTGTSSGGSGSSSGTSPSGDSSGTSGSGGTSSSSGSGSDNSGSSSGTAGASAGSGGSTSGSTGSSGSGSSSSGSSSSSSGSSSSGSGSAGGGPAGTGDSSGSGGSAGDSGGTSSGGTSSTGGNSGASGSGSSDGGDGDGGNGGGGSSHGHGHGHGGS